MATPRKTDAERQRAPKGSMGEGRLLLRLDRDTERMLAEALSREQLAGKLVNASEHAARGADCRLWSTRARARRSTRPSA